MKIWHGYGSEHSMNLVMIGKFKSAEDAQQAFDVLEQLRDGLDGEIDLDMPRDRYSEEVMELLRHVNVHNLSPKELEQFLFGHDISLEGDRIILTTEESEVSAFFKTMVEKGAIVEMFSAHDYPEAKYGRGK